MSQLVRLDGKHTYQMHIVHCPSSSLEQVHGQLLASTPRHLDLLFEQLRRHSTRATPPPVVGCSAVVKQHKIYKFLCTNNFFARNHQKMHLGALFNISLREKGRWGWEWVQIKLLKGRLNTFRIKGANDQIWGHIAISSQLELILFCLWSVR